MPNTTRTDWKKKCGELETENQALTQKMQEIVTAARVLAKDKDQVERELSATRTAKVAVEDQLEQILQAIQAQQEAVADVEDDGSGDLAEVISLPSDETT